MTLDQILDIVMVYLPTIVSIVVMITTMITAIKKCNSSSDVAVDGVKEQTRINKQLKQEMAEEVKLMKAENEALRQSIREENELTRAEINKLNKRRSKVKVEE